MLRKHQLYLACLSALNSAQTLHFTWRTLLGNETAGLRELRFSMKLPRRTCLKGVVVGCLQHGLIRAHQHPGSDAPALLGSQSDCSVASLRVLFWYRCQRCVGGCRPSAEVLRTRGHRSEATTSQSGLSAEGNSPPSARN